MNKHHVYVVQVIHYRYEVELPDGDPFTQQNEARFAARARFESGDRPPAQMIRDNTVWDFASTPRGTTDDISRRA